MGLTYHPRVLVSIDSVSVLLFCSNVHTYRFRAQYYTTVPTDIYRVLVIAEIFIATKLFAHMFSLVIVPKRRLLHFFF
jgi:hypothetical protein